MKIKAFAALRPPVEIVNLVASVPYDTVDTEEARALADGNPCSLLRISRPEIDFPKGTDMYAKHVYERAVENFSKFQEENILIREQKPYVYVYRQKMGDHIQRGIVTCCHIDDYANNVIRKHEKTRQDKEDDRTRHVKMLKANTGPVFLAYRDVPAIDEIVALAEKQKPLYDLVASDGISHTVWRVESGSDKLIAEFGKVPVCYIADGHHRAAAAARAGMEMRKANHTHNGMEEYNWFLAVLFPAGQLRILPYNRIVADLNGMTESNFLDAIKKRFKVSSSAPANPPAACSVSMYLGKKWYGLSWEASRTNDPVSALDVSYLQNNLLDPLLGIKDPRTDKRIEFVGGIRGTGELVKRVDSGKGVVAFSMYPVTVDQMMAIADAGSVMPPKSTWFEPKLRSGLLIHTL
ncbi:MAG: DUF1015 family protein [Kiritimatiellae bacterium]|nr:DUF1015 family protein [Kiritimatiellia bacterium]MDD5523030.1 DUF1015 family protein [Kiritimatiellia bacterium]